MAPVLEFFGTQFKTLASDTRAVVLTIGSTFPTLANAGVKLLKDNGDGSGSQVGQAVVIDTALDTPQADNATMTVDGEGRYAIVFQGQATAVDVTGVRALFTLTTDRGALVEDFGGPRSDPSISTLINGTGFFVIPGAAS